MTHVISRVECGCFSICDWHSKWERKGEGDADKKSRLQSFDNYFFKELLKRNFSRFPPLHIWEIAATEMAAKKGPLSSSLSLVCEPRAVFLHLAPSSFPILPG